MSSICFGSVSGATKAAVLNVNGRSRHGLELSISFCNCTFYACHTRPRINNGRACCVACHARYDCRILSCGSEHAVRTPTSRTNSHFFVSWRKIILVLSNSVIRSFSRRRTRVDDEEAFSYSFMLNRGSLMILRSVKWSRPWSCISKRRTGFGYRFMLDS